MDKFTALHGLGSSRAHDRLTSARFLAKTATVEDIDLIEKALRKENVSWVRNALKLAISRATGDFEAERPTSQPNDEQSATNPDRQIEEIYSNALEEATGQLLHEIEPLLGIARLYAEREIKHFDNSKTRIQFDLLDRMLGAISKLRKASNPGQNTEFDLGALLREVKEQEGQARSVEVQLAGQSTFNAIADRERLWIAIKQGLRNAIEATEAVEAAFRRPVVVNWGKTDQDFWISIIDHGIGLKGSLERIFDIGTSRKKDHLGMGLPTARQAIASMGGTVSVSPRDEVGAQFEIRWPRYVTSPI